MFAVTIDSFGGPDVLGWSEVPEPVPGPGELLIDIAASAVNRADLLQRQGNYPPPPGASQILGLECAGTVAVLGAGVNGWQVGDRVCALLAGGGYAERVAVPAEQVLPVPACLDLTHAAALPEVACTVWSNLVMVADVRPGQVVLIHGGSSGIGTMAIQVCRALGATVAVTASSATKLDACRDLGAQICINYREQDFVAEVAGASDGHGADVILDIVGAKYLHRNVSALALDGMLVVIGMQGGTSGDLDLGALLRKRGTIAATALRSRPVSGPGSKGEIVASVREHLWPMIADGRVRPIVDRVVPMTQAADAHRVVAESTHIGKIVMTVPREPQR